MLGEHARDERDWRTLTARRLLVALDDTGVPPPQRTASLLAALAIPGVARPVVETGPDERTWLPVFSSAEAARRWRPAARVHEAPGEQVLALAERLGCAEVVLDPAGPAPLRLPAGPVPQSRRRAARIRPLSTPIGHDVIQRLDRELAGERAVGRVWLVELALEGEDVLFVGVEVPGRDPAEAERVVKALEPLLAPLLPVPLYDGVEFRALTDPALAAEVAATDTPVYRRRPG